MGQERIVFLPWTIPWLKLVKGLEGVTSVTNGDIAALASKTLEQVRERFSGLFRDARVQAALGFPVALARSKAATEESRPRPPSSLQQIPPPASINRT